MSEKELYRRLGRAVAERREELELTQDKVASQLGLSRASLANIENGRQRIMVHQLFRLANALKRKSILELVPAAWAFDDDLPIKATGEPLSAEEQLSVEKVLASALADDRRRKKSA
jgi:transcriptional regulator with XRE-family HTH domain